jgi:UDP-N-acetylmuramate--alanine ligase
MDDFAGSFSDADILYLMDIYAAGEKPIEGISSQTLLEAIRQRGGTPVIYVPVREGLAKTLCEGLLPGDVLFTLGAGDVWKVGEEFLKRMKEEG